jgi:D-3-phosphoglycerate dehydrogenase / 2-oxoglutarate reductase
MRVVVTTNRFDPAAQTLLAEEGVEIRTIGQQASSEAVVSLLAGFDPHGLISRGVVLTEAVIAAAPSLRVIAKTGVGVDNIDVDAATRRGIPVLSNVGVNAESVAEHALALTFALARNIARHDALMRAGIWSRFHFRAYELRGKQLGLIGFGHSAQRLAEMAEGLGMAVCVHAPRYRQGAPSGNVRAMSSLAALLERSDIVSLHCPLTDETRGMIDGSAISGMRKGAWLINVSRGAVVDEGALLDGLRSGQLGGAALDVHAHEPMPAEHPLFALNNVVLTPHVAGSTIQSTVRAHVTVARNVLAVLNGKPFDTRTIVNPGAVEKTNVRGTWTPRTP